MFMHVYIYLFCLFLSVCLSLFCGPVCLIKMNKRIIYKLFTWQNMSDSNTLHKSVHVCVATTANPTCTEYHARRVQCQCTHTPARLAVWVCSALYAQCFGWLWWSHHTDWFRDFCSSQWVLTVDCATCCATVRLASDAIEVQQLSTVCCGR